MKKHVDQSLRLEACLQSGVDWKTRTAYIVGVMDEAHSYNIIPALRMMDETPGPIKVVIMSSGGEETVGFAILDTLTSMKNVVTTIGYGGVYSIAALVLQGGDIRLMAPNAQLMIHNGSVQIEGGMIDTDLIKKLSEDSERNNLRYHKVLADRARRDLIQIQDWCKVEKTFSANEAVESGLADSVLYDWKELKK